MAKDRDGKRCFFQQATRRSWVRDTIMNQVSDALDDQITAEARSSAVLALNTSWSPIISQTRGAIIGQIWDASLQGEFDGQ